MSKVIWGAFPAQNIRILLKRTFFSLELYFKNWNITQTKIFQSAFSHIFQNYNLYFIKANKIKIMQNWNDVGKQWMLQLFVSHVNFEGNENDGKRFLKFSLCLPVQFCIIFKFFFEKLQLGQTGQCQVVHVCKGLNPVWIKKSILLNNVLRNISMSQTI